MNYRSFCQWIIPLCASGMLFFIYVNITHKGIEEVRPPITYVQRPAKPAHFDDIPEVLRQRSHQVFENYKVQKNNFGFC
jgi:hypothetical protein